MKRKFLALVLSFALGVSMLAGCGNGGADSSNDKKDGTTSVSQDAGTTDNKNSESGKNTTGKDTSSDGGSVVPETADYTELLNELYEYIFEFNYDEPDYAEGMTGICEILAYDYKEDNAFKAFGYAVKDINGDGTEELIIVENNEDATHGKNILAAYTWNGGKPVLLVEGYSRDAFALLDDGTLYEYGSMGAMSTLVAVYALKAGSSELGVEKLLFTYFEDDMTTSVYSADEIVLTPSDAELTDMSADDFWDYTMELEERAVDIDFTLFYDYEYSGSKNYKKSDKEVVITPYWADDTMPDKADYVDPYIAEYGLTGTEVMFSTNTEVYNFSIMKFAIDEYMEEDDSWFHVEANVGTITPEKDVFAMLAFAGDLPQYAISFRDVNGEYYCYFVEISGEDGSLILVDLWS